MTAGKPSLRRVVGSPRALVVAPGRSPTEIAAFKGTLSLLDVTAARSLDDACRIIEDRCPEVVVVDGALDDGALAKRVVALAQGKRAERVAAAGDARLQAAQTLGRTTQWQLDPEARSFAWLSHGAAQLAELAGEGSLAERFLRFVHPEDRPRVEDAIARVASGPIEARLTLPSGEEREIVQELLERRDPISGRAVILGTVLDVTEERTRQRVLERVTHYDASTGLPNRAHVSAYLEAALETAQRRSSSVAVVSVGVDAFRTVEDTFGRGVSEAVLREVAARLRAALEEGAPEVRGSDGLTARHGPYELLVVLREASAEDAAAFFARASARLQAPIALEGTPLVVTCSAGVAVASGTSATPVHAEMMLAHADAALHAAMAEGRARVVIHAQKMRDALDRKRVVEQRLRESLAAGVGLELHYQPKVDARSRRVRAVEALLRSSADPRGPISPLELVAVAEERGLIHALGDFILRTASEQACRWANDGRPLRVAVNVSAHQLARADFVEHVAGVLAETGLSPDLLELEITEGAMMADIEGACGLLLRLKSLGVRIALDDFGTGYSSLAYLTRLPIDTLKIDRSFVKEIGVSAKGEAILRGILALSQSLGLEVVAEGVETAAQEAFLVEHGNLEIQGWLYAKALPPRELDGWLDQRETAGGVCA